ncbi:MAG: PQQ-binding-like beta-propeller repeat protein [Pseudomonadota bacterium]
MSLAGIAGVLGALLCAQSEAARTGPDAVGKPWGRTPGMHQFRGNPSHTWYGQGPVPDHPVVLWRFPRTERMCSQSAVGTQDKRWCGTGWTGQPVLRELADGRHEVIVGTFDKRVIFLDGGTGVRTRPDFKAHDLVKGTVSLDPDGYPLLYFGSRDNKLRVVALDRPRPTELWALDSNDYPGLHNNDWDANPSVVDDLLIEGGENSYLFTVMLHRSLDAGGLAQVQPEVKLVYPGWTPELLAELGDHNVSIENSPAVFGDRIYFANSGGRIVGLNLAAAREGRAQVEFDFWIGDDVDASIVVDAQGMLYVAAELERKIARPRQVGQLAKLDPSRPQDPLVWRLFVPALAGDPRGGGIWSTPALHRDVLYVTTQSGKLLVVDRDTGHVQWWQTLSSHLWSSPVVVDDTLLVATCQDGKIHAYDVSEPRTPKPRWVVKVGWGGCIESTPLVYKGRIYVGTWDGFVYALGERTVARRPAASKKNKR